ncbi:aldo-keto reductase family 1 member B1-like [Panulirus ornatus]|uniref:aldo-keto reductase family 1 member B1-like n=1 Tax=Panulirus ornatus TaxID=150431 RepID=UPI003A884BDE
MRETQCPSESWCDSFTMADQVPSIELGNGGNMPYIGLGTFKTKDCEMRESLRVALECGYRHVDTATFYQNEDAIGEVLQEWLASGKVTREEVFITTKLPRIGNRAGDVARFLQKSLEKLRVSYVDLYLFHHPVGAIGKDDDDLSPVDSEGNSINDPDTDLESVWKAIEEQVDAGRARNIGLSNFNIVQIERILKVCRIRPANLQVEVHAYHQQRDLRALCHKHGISVCAFGPLGAPYMADGAGERPVLLEHPKVVSIANRLARTPAQVLLRFLIQLGMAVIPKSSNPDRIRQNFQVFDFELSTEDMSSLEDLDCGKEGKIFTMEFSKSHPECPF